jgi:hypothetical protein
MFSVVSVLFVALIGCRAGGDARPAAAGAHQLANNTDLIANHTALADNAGQSDPGQICPDICGAGTLCEFPDGSCTEACNPCYCTREGGTVVDACPQDDSAQRAIRATASQTVAAGDGDRAR